MMTRNKVAVTIAGLFLCGTLVSCSPSEDKGGKGGGESVKLQGAGASFPAPLYMKWFKDYGAAHSDVMIDYQSVGSGSGVKSVIDKTVDFGASDAAMKPDEIAKVDVGVQLLPMTAGAIVLAYNLEGVDNLKLSREAYTGIFLGNVTKWNDPAIAATNEGASLPDSNINVIVRADSSGTTFVFTKHLAEISEQFAENPGVNKAPDWPGSPTKSKGNEGVTASLKTTPGSIGYIEFGYAKGAKLSMAALENKAGEFIAPTIESAQAAMAAVEMPDSLIAWMPDPEGKESYPIVTFTWLLLYKEYEEAKLKAIKDVVEYCLTEGQKSSEKLGYIPLPEAVVTKVRAALDNVKAAGGEAKEAA
jgi:phosphate transport system substrate-binding protein